MIRFLAIQKVFHRLNCFGLEPEAPSTQSKMDPLSNNIHACKYTLSVMWKMCQIFSPQILYDVVPGAPSSCSARYCKQLA